MKVVLFDTPDIYENLLPLSYTRPVAEFRIGIVTIREKWEHYLGVGCSWLTIDYLSEKFPCGVESDEEALFIAGNKLPEPASAFEVKSLRKGDGLRDSE